MEVDRCPTGIAGLDELLEGGFPRGRVILVAGGCGTGKSTLAVQFLCNGITRYGEPGVLVTLEQHPMRIKQEMLVMGFDLEALEREGKLAIVDASLSDIIFKERGSQFALSPTASFGMESILGLIEDAANKVGAKRAVVDSFSALDTLIETRRSHTSGSIQEDSRKTTLGINYKFQSLGLTSILTKDLFDDHRTGRYGMEEFIADGVITLHYNVSGPDTGRHLIIKKMRSTKHSENINTIEFVRGEGIRVKGF
ncbi:MAG: ATPase domain-containing protein [Candidatus Altiarchaeota archaeon]